jgi:predicted dehydrogenase
MRSRRFNIVGAYDQKAQSSRRFANRFRTKCFEGLDELLDDPSVKAIAATVPNQFHADIVKSAADAGKHVFIEKPLASDPEICRELGLYCRDKGIVLQVGHQMRREPVFREMNRILKGGALGQPLYAQAVYTLDRRSRVDWRQDAGSCPGGSMEQLGAHLIDAVIYLFGLPTGTQSWSENIPRVSDAPDWGSVSLSFDHDFHSVISTSFSSPVHMRMEVFLTGGHLSTDGHTLWIDRPGSDTRRIKPRGLAGGVAQFIEFADCIECGKETETGAAEAAAVMDIVSSIHEGKKRQGFDRSG